MNESEEGDLVRRCKNGDKEAFCSLIELHHSVIFGTAYLMTHDRSMAEDVVQESLINMWKHIPSLRQQSSVKPWLIRIVVNEVKQQFRKKRVQVIPLDEALDIPDEVEDIETNTIRHEEQEDLMKTLNKLPEEQREILILRYFSDLTVPEIALIKGKREGTIKSRLSRNLGATPSDPWQ